MSERFVSARVFWFVVALANSTLMQEKSSDFEWIHKGASSQEGPSKVDAGEELSLIQVGARFKPVSPWTTHAVSVDGTLAGEASLSKSMMDHIVKSDDRDIAPAFLQLALQTDANKDGSFLGAQATSRRWAQIVSAGNEDGNKAHFLLDGTRLDMPQGRGLNVVTMGPACMEARMRTETFDTWGDASASDRFEAFLSALPVGDFVLLAVKDDGSEHLSPSARKAIREQLGGVEADRLTYGDAYALFAAKGDGFALLERYVSRTEGPATLGFELPSAALPAWRCWAAGLYEDAPRPDGAFYVCFSATIVFYGILAASKLGYLGDDGSLSEKPPRKCR